MQTLREIQEQFAKHLQEIPTEPNIAQSIKFNTLKNSQRLQVYKNNYKISLKNNLACIFPVVEKLVGKEFFGFSCSEFIKKHPSTNGNLHEYGKEFADFLAQFEPAQTLKYLPDMARFEWGYHAVFHEADSPLVDIEALKKLSEHDYLNLVFTLNRATRLVSSNFPLLKIWQANQIDDPPPIDMETKAYFYLIGRRNRENIFQTLSEIEFHFLCLILNNTRFEDISTALTNKFDPSQVDLNSLLVKNVATANISTFDVISEPPDKVNP